MAWQTPKTNWQAADVVSKDDFNRIEGNIQELQDTKETSAGAQAKVDTHANSKQTHGISSGYYIAKTSRSDQLPAWNDIQGKPDLALASDLDAHLADYVLQVPYGVATGSANTYAVTLNPAPSAYVDGMAIAVKINVNNTGTSTINVNGLGAKTIKKPNGNNVSAGNLKAGSIYSMRYNGTNFILQGSDAAGNATPGDVLSGKTFSNDEGEQIGSMPNRGAVVITPSTTNQVIAAGYHNGSGYVKGDANLVARNIKKGVSIFGVSGSVKPGWVLFMRSGLYNSYNWGNFVAGYTDGTPWNQEILSYAIFLDTGPDCNDVAVVTNDPIDLTGIDYVCAIIDPNQYGAKATYLIADTNKVAPYSTYVARVSGEPDVSGAIQGLVLNVSSLSGLYYIRLHVAEERRFIHCYLVSLG